ncbi:hypothetical protein RUM43_000422 [Polyplax serrata]|uniref:Uncharacterized protein n=1 Tax=Polyplax serrata TaxID=468196 RepID=A0AAN8XP04_POLSC
MKPRPCGGTFSDELLAFFVLEGQGVSLAPSQIRRHYLEEDEKEKALINENSINEQGRKQNEEGKKKVNEEKINVRVEAGEFAVPAAAAAEDMFSSGICSGFNKLYTYTKIKERRKEETPPTSRRKRNIEMYEKPQSRKWEMSSSKTEKFLRSFLLPSDRALLLPPENSVQIIDSARTTASVEDFHRLEKQ